MGEKRRRVLAGESCDHASLVSTDVEAVFGQALQMHQRGELASASAVYEAILAKSPRHANSLHYLGVAHFQQGHLESAAERMAHAILLDEKRADFYSNFGLVLAAQGMPDEAIAAYGRALALQPEYPEAYKNLGDALATPSRPSSAHDGDRGTSLAKVLRKLGREEEPTGRQSHDAEAHTSLGNRLVNLGKLDIAILLYRRALALSPGHVDAYCNLGTALNKQGAVQQAVEQYREALRIDPGHADAHYNLGHTLYTLGQGEQATAHYRLALKERPLFAEAWIGLGTIALDRCEVEQAIHCYERALVLRQKQPATSQADLIANHMALGMMHLTLGNFQEGLPHFEWKNKALKLPSPCDRARPWKGRALHGAKILLVAEQGLGDTLQFLRYVPLVQQAGGKVILCVQAGLRRLVEQMQDVAVYSFEDALPLFDTYCPLMSLPSLFGTTLQSIPANVPYLAVPEEALRQAVDLPWPEDGLRVGLVWAGNTAHPKDHLRSLSFSQLEPLLEIAAVDFYSLQVGPAASQAGSPLHDLWLTVDNMADTAARIAQLHLVITADTAMAHLAGAMGVPVWVMVPFTPDWRWLLHREDSPWYPTMRLFRQSTAGDWEGVIARVGEELRHLSMAASTREDTGHAEALHLAGMAGG